MQENAYLVSRKKRLLDVMGALLGLTLGLPVFTLAVVVVVLVDNVNPFFVQQRIGLGGVGFDFLKLRTLKVKEDYEVLSTEVVSSKMTYECTTTGKFWRKTSIDEIFQFWYVLKGRMSLIGHRPIPVDYVDFLSNLEGMDEGQVANYLSTIYKMKPGLSSLSSVKGRTNLTMQEKMKLDLEYADKASFRFDLSLLSKTIFYAIILKDT